MKYQKRLPFSLGVAFCAAALFAISCSNVLADLDIQGGSPDQREQIRNIYNNRVPSAWRTARMVNIHILNDVDMNAYIRDGSDEHMLSGDADDTIDGIFEDDPPTITLRGSSACDAIPFTFAHEFGHFFWQNELTKADRCRYANIYGRQKRSHHLVTDYAGVDVHEGFAEAFSYYVIARKTLARRDALSCKFLDAVLERSAR
jgi:hypothetical protein